MKKLHKFLALAAFVPFLAACTPSDEDLCNHVMEIAKKENPKADSDKEPTDEEMKKHLADCVEDLGKRKKDIGEEEFKTMAKCVMAADSMEGIGKCNEKKDKKDKEE